MADDRAGVPDVPVKNTSNARSQTPGDITHDHILAGRLSLRQHRDGYRAAVDSILLGAAVSQAPGAALLELGCGAGAALMTAALMRGRSPFLGVEQDTQTAALAAENLEANGLTDHVGVVAADITALPEVWRDRVDVTFFNPPYMDDPASVRAPKDARRRRAFVMGDGPGVNRATLGDWIAAALMTTRSRGWIVLIHRADRLADILHGLHAHTGATRILPIAPKQGAPAHRVLVAARKGVRTPTTLLAPLALHEPDGSPTHEAAAILAGDSPPALWP